MAYNKTCYMCGHSYERHKIVSEENSLLKIEFCSAEGCTCGREVDLNKPEPEPVKKDSVAIWDLVVEDMKKRNRVGTEKYGTPLQAFNGRDALVDAYQEALDLVVYLRQKIEEEKINDSPTIDR